MKKILITEFILLFVILFPCMGLSADSFLLQNIPDKNPKLEFRFMRPFFSDEYSWNSDLAALAGTYDISLIYPIKNNYSLIASIPIVNYHVDYVMPYFDPFVEPVVERKERSIGNIFIGAQKHWSMNNFKNVNLMFAIYIPTS